MSTYAWIIDRDHLDGPDAENNRVGRIGPSDAPQELIDRLMTNDGGVKWRCKDDDGEVYYSGRLVLTHREQEVVESSEGGEHFKPGMFLVTSSWEDDEGFGPLWDFCRPDAGATDIEYRDTTRKVWASL